MMNEMKMRVGDALNLLGLKLDATTEAIKFSYKRKAKEFHPDVNPAGEEMMKILNLAFEVLQGYDPQNKSFHEKAYADGWQEQDLAGPMNEALKMAMSMEDVEIRWTGIFLWLNGNTRTYVKQFKQWNDDHENTDNSKWRYAGKKKEWYWRPGNWTSSSSSRGSYSKEERELAHGVKVLKSMGKIKLSA